MWDVSTTTGKLIFFSPDKPGFNTTITVTSAGAARLIECGELLLDFSTEAAGKVESNHTGVTATIWKSSVSSVPFARIRVASDEKPAFVVEAII